MVGQLGGCKVVMLGDLVMLLLGDCKVVGDSMVGWWSG